MIVDCHTHVWESPAQLGSAADAAGAGKRSAMGGRELELPLASADRHFSACEHVDVTLVAGFQSRYLQALIPNDQIASYVRQHPDRLVGLAGIDPSDSKSAIDELQRAREELGLVGAAIAPAAQDFHPSDSKAMVVYQKAAELRMPVLFHSGIYPCATTKLEYAQPVLLDEVAREIPELKILIANVGAPWMAETLTLLAKHTNVYAEISGILNQPWQAYQMLLSAWQGGVIHKLLFGSGFPFAVAAHCIEAIYDINQMCHGTNLPAIPREELRSLVERDALPLLGINFRRPVPQAKPPSESLLTDDVEVPVPNSNGG